MLNIEEERARFEAWHYSHFGRAVHRASPAHGGAKPGLEYWGDDTNHAWAGWLEARRASSAAAVPVDALPPLPDPDHSLDCGMQPFYRPDQMQRYAIAAVMADRESQGKPQACKSEPGAWSECQMQTIEAYEAIKRPRAAVEADRAQRPETITLNGRTHTAAEVKQRLLDYDAENVALHEQHERGAQHIAKLEAALADRAQQGEPVGCIKCPRDPSKVCDYCGHNLYATKAAAPADATQQQEKVVRVAPAPAGQHDASGADLTDDEIEAILQKHTTYLSGWEWSGDIIDCNGSQPIDFAREIEAEVQRRCRAQRTTIDKLNSAAPHPSEAKAGEPPQ